MALELPLMLVVAMAGAPGAYSEDILTRIVNVHWSGLAVIFGETDQDAPPKEEWPK